MFLFNRVFCSFKMFMFRCVGQVHQISPTKPTLKLHQISPNLSSKKSNKTNSGRFSDFPDPTSDPPRWAIWTTHASMTGKQANSPSSPPGAAKPPPSGEERFFGFSPEDTKICQILLEVDVNSSSWYIYHLSIYHLSIYPANRDNLKAHSLVWSHEPPSKI